jgi:hypothetical protein
MQHLPVFLVLDERFEKVGEPGNFEQAVQRQTALLGLV